MPARLTAEAIIALLHLAPHPEGGHFREVFRDHPAGPEGRGFSTAIYYLLDVGETSEWHRVDAAEIWHFYSGSPLALQIADEHGHRTLHLGPDLMAGEVPQIVVPAGAWQAAESIGDWTLVGCTVAPGFEFAGFELAPPGWVPES